MTQAIVSPAPKAGRYDAGRRRRSVRRGREGGCWVYIPADELRAAGYRPGEDRPWYRLWGRGRGSVLIRLYRED